MPPEVAERVMEPFFTTKEVGRGSGLGLSMVHGFVKQSGGHLEIQSQVGRGTTIKLYFPKAEIVAKAPKTAPTPATVVRGQGMVVLLVEDDGNLRRTVAKMLANMGFQVLEAEDGKVALSILKNTSKVDLLFTDIVMPGEINGIDLVKKARAERPELKVLLMSGYAEEDFQRAGVSSENSAFLPKPFLRQSLAVELQRLLGV